MDSKGPFLHAALTHRIIREFYRVYDYFGYGFQESGYRRSLGLALRKAGMRADEELACDMVFEGSVVGRYRIDLLVDRTVIVEAKAGLNIDPAAAVQLLNYLKLKRLEVGLLLHFGPRPAVKRLISSRTRLEDITPLR